MHTNLGPGNDFKQEQTNRQRRRMMDNNEVWGNLLDGLLESARVLDAKPDKDKKIWRDVNEDAGRSPRWHVWTN